MTLKKDDINKVAHLARLELSQGQVDSLTKDMNNIIGYIDKLAELETENIEPTSHAVPVTNAFREDALKEYFTVEKGLANAPDGEDGSFKVPKVID
ncbi:MAG: Asp-tRNA(Asn)/Glu-tRNA(Gln) amidotransferase subunit GatC [Deltaproteobacteria bacterium]|nr:Asp-tRNA(Asn)/Glu-tRNA(Gln) amidotransferase subunit GatC [Deltaproteobacteria bacterium]